MSPTPVSHHCSNPDHRASAVGAMKTRFIETGDRTDSTYKRGQTGEQVRCIKDSGKDKRGEDRTLSLWDARSGALIREVKSGTALMFSVAMPPDGKQNHLCWQDCADVRFPVG
jgi:hypothetical protein